MSFLPHPQIQDLLAAISDQFAVDGKFIEGVEIPTGHINTTYRASYQQDDGGIRRYIIQNINRHVFKDPYAVMRNVETVTRHINARAKTSVQDASGQTLSLIPANDGQPWVEDDQGTIWRCYNFIEGCVTYDIVENPGQAYQAAFAFGAFQDLVSDLDANLIAETIADFHNTPKRFFRLLDVATEDPHQRLQFVRAEFDFILKREPLTKLLIDLANCGKIPTRVTHNDTKINNVMIDAKTDEAVCVIDLDTVMPGLALYDFGDLMRSATNPAAEDEQDLSKVKMEMPLFEALVEGYLDAAANFLIPTEVENLVNSGKLITLELATRFLTDHLEGDVYFKTHRPDHNLDRCRTQLRLLESMEEQEVEMQAFVESY